MNEWEEIRAELREWVHNLPSPREMARETKRQAIEARQVARAVRGIEWAPPLIHNGKAAR